MLKSRENIEGQYLLILDNGNDFVGMEAPFLLFENCVKMGVHPQGMSIYITKQGKTKPIHVIVSDA